MKNNNSLKEQPKISEKPQKNNFFKENKAIAVLPKSKLSETFHEKQEKAEENTNIFQKSQPRSK